jgi:hypothetical protein
VPRLTLAFALQRRKNHEKTSVRVTERRSADQRHWSRLQSAMKHLKRENFILEFEFHVADFFGLLFRSKCMAKQE